MSDEVEVLIRQSRPRIPDASPSIVHTALADAHASAGAPTRSSHRWRNAVVLAVAMAAVIAAFVAGLFVAPSSGASGSVALQSVGPDYGVSLTLPAGWSGRIYNEQPPAAQSAAFLQAGDFPLPQRDDDVGTSAAASMHAQNVLIIMWEAFGAGGGFDYVPLSKAPQVTSGDFGVSLEGFPPGHDLARLFFELNGRKFVLIVEAGTSAVTQSQIDTVNAVLATLQIS